MLSNRKSRSLIKITLCGGLALLSLTGCGDLQNSPATAVPAQLVTAPATTVAVSSTEAVTAKLSEQPSPATSATEQLKPVGTAILNTNGPVVTVPTLPQETPVRSRTTPGAISPPSLKSNEGLLQGRVVSAPGCPVARAGNPCPPQPLSHRNVQIKAQKQSNLVVKTATTDNDGYFVVELALGAYIAEVTPASNSVERRKPYAFEIVASQTIALEIVVDSGIR